jgi:hypothetical protein
MVTYVWIDLKKVQKNKMIEKYYVYRKAHTKAKGKAVESIRQAVLTPNLRSRVAELFNLYSHPYTLYT